MKKTKLFGLALIATMTSFSACTNDAEEALTQESEIKLTSEVIPTSRTLTQDLQSTSIVANRQVGITITGAKGPHSNKPWKVNADKSLTNMDEKLYWGDGNAKIYAYHPYNEAWTGNSHTFSVQIDQSEDLGYLNSDLLLGYTEAAKTTGAVAIPFIHCLSKINVTLSSDDIDNLAGAIVYICGTDIDLTINPFHNIQAGGGFSSNTSSTIQDIKAGIVEVESLTVSAIVIPQVVKVDTKFIKVELNDKDYYYILPNDLTLNQSAEYTFNLKLKEKEALVELKGGSHNIINWSGSSIFNSNAGEEDGITDIYQAEAGTFSSIVGDYGYFSDLKLSGNINNSDLTYIQNKSLRYLDLSDATLVGTTDWDFDTYMIFPRHLFLPKNIVNITGYTKDTGLKTITIPAGVHSITGTWDALEEIHCKATIPPTTTASCWVSAIDNNCKLYVPTSAKSAYESADVWKEFEIIAE